MLRPGTRKLLLFGLLALAIGVHAGLLLYWIHLDQSVGRPVAAGMMWPVSNLVQLEAQGDLRRVFLDFRPGWIIWLALGARHIFGTHPDTLLWLVLIFMVATQLVLFDIGRLLESPATGIVIAALFPLYPDVAMMTRRWAPMIPQFFCLVAAADMLIRSRSFSRLFPSIGFVLIASIGIDMSTMSTDNEAFLPGLGAMALGAWLRGFFLGQGPRPNEKAARWKTLFIGALSATALGYVVWHSGILTYDIHYVRAEIASDKYEHFYARWSLPALSAYVRYLYRLSISPVLFIPFLAALVPYLWKGRARAELLCWLLIPLIVFSLINKKNPYYIFTVLPVFPLVTVMGFQTMSRRDVKIALATLLLALAGLQWFNRSFPDPRRPLARYMGAAGMMRDMNKVFETAIVPNLHPEPHFRHSREAWLLYPHMSRRVCHHPTIVQFLYPDDFQDVRLILTAKDPCVDVKAWPDISLLANARWVVVADEMCSESKEIDATGADTAGIVANGVDAAAANDPVGTRRTVSSPSIAHLVTEQNNDSADEPRAPWAATAKKVASGHWHELVAEDRLARPCLKLYKRKSGVHFPVWAAGQPR